MKSNPGRVAGVAYLLFALTGPFHLIYVPRLLFVRGDAAATAHNIAAHEMLLRVNALAGFVAAVFFTLIALLLYRVFKDVNRGAAVLMVVFAVMSAVIGFMTELNSLAALAVVRENFMSAFDTAQREAFVLLFVRMRGLAMTANELFWGLWLLPMALLVYRSQFIPRFIGVWLAIDGVAWVVACCVGLLAPQYSDRLFTWFQPAYMGELVLMFWLIVKGAAPRPVRAEAVAGG
ncbi:MAG: DUF4386 domain-containing protein [Terriglobales bacterium]